MKKLGFIFIILSIFFLGILIGRPDNNSTNKIINSKIDEFENDIISSDNNYNSKEGMKDFINPNITNRFGKIGEEMIDKVTSISKSFIKKILE